MFKNNKNGASNAVLVLVIFIGVALIAGAIGLTILQNKKVNPYSENNTETESMISTTIDTVPIPKGFYYVGGTKATGLVISDSAADKDRGENHEVAKTLVGNQYVWVPVSDIAGFKRNLSNSFNVPNVSSKIIQTFDTDFGINLWEVAIDETTGNVNAAYTDKTLAEAKALYASVKKYGGFYIARFEASLVSPRVKVKDANTGNESYPKLTGADIISKSGSYPCNYLSWSNSYDLNGEDGGVVELARAVYPSSNTNISVVSTLVYGVQWDAITSFCSSANKSNYGNFINSTFSFVGKYLMDENAGTYITDNISSDKEGGKATLYTTASTSYTKINNIYDLAGSLSEWTMEGMTMITNDSISYARITRGGSFKQEAVNLSNREYRLQTYSDIDVGFRVALYIK